MTVVFLGNFKFVFCTESHHAWTWEQLGHKVIRLQEGVATTDEIWNACQQPDVKVFQWTHSHGYGMPGSIPIEELLRRIRAKGIKSFSYHLDVYWGLNQLDKRQDRIGQHASWKVDKFYSTDGGNHDWAGRGVNHVYLPAGVVEYGCHLGQFNQAQASLVGFVGSIGYHPEYPFRTRLIEQLRRVYSGKFRTYAGMREEALNSVYASCQIVVGDHCFAGIPRYASDRLFETVGRGGFIIYPRTEGVTDMIPGLATYEAQNMTDLYNQIAYFINHPQEREQRRLQAHEWVKANATYTNRLKFIQQDMEI